MLKLATIIAVVCLAACGGGGDDVPTRPLQPGEICLGQQANVGDPCPADAIRNGGPDPGPQTRP